MKNLTIFCIIKTFQVKLSNCYKYLRHSRNSIEFQKKYKFQSHTVINQCEMSPEVPSASIYTQSC